jgi:hypothetical protein
MIKYLQSYFGLGTASRRRRILFKVTKVGELVTRGF